MTPNHRMPGCDSESTPNAADDLADEAAGLSRRAFLKGGGALVLGIGLTACAPGEQRVPMLSSATAAASAEPGSSPTAARFVPDAFVRIASDDTVTVVIKHIEFGQGPYTGLATLVAEELDADWSQMRAVAAPADDERYANLKMGRQGTGGSTAIANSYDQMRKAGAAAKQMLVEAAAEAWSVPVTEIRVSKGVIRHAATGRSGRFSEFLEAASKRPVPSDPVLKEPKDFVLIGHEIPKLDSLEKSNGTAQFTIDVFREDMRVAVVAHAPKFGARVASFDDRAALAVDGVFEVAEVPQGVAVFARDTWAATQGRKALRIEWDDAAAEKRSSAELFELYSEAVKKTGAVAAEKGDVRSALDAKGHIRLEAEYRFPFLAHAMMEPLDAVIENDASGNGVVVFMGSQAPTRDQSAIAETLGLDKSQVEMRVQLAGGSFGRRAQMDAHFATEAADVFKAQSGPAANRRPIKLLYTREDDIQGGYYRPLVVHRLAASMTPDGRLAAWEQSVASQTFFAGSAFAGFLKSGVDRTMVEGASDLPYATDNLLVSNHIMDAAIPTLWWRSVGHTHTGFAVEAFLDELLEKTGIDPVEGRLRLLGDHPRERAVLEKAAKMAHWGRVPDPGKAFGVAVHRSFGTYVAQIVEIEAAKNPERPKVLRVWCAVDCGIPVNPNVIRAQMEGGIGFGLGAALYSEIEIEPGGTIRQKNFDTYRNLRINDMPEVEVSIIASNEDPTGVGEPGVPPIAPAVANAWRRLTGKRVSRLPMVAGA